MWKSLIESLPAAKAATEEMLVSFMRFLDFEILGVAFAVGLITSVHYNFNGPYWFAGSLAIVVATVLSACVRPPMREPFVALGETAIRRAGRPVVGRLASTAYWPHTVWMLLAIGLLYSALIAGTKNEPVNYRSLCRGEPPDFANCWRGIASVVLYSVGLGIFVSTLQLFLIKKRSDDAIRLAPGRPPDADGTRSD